MIAMVTVNPADAHIETLVHCSCAGEDAAPPESQVYADFMRIILEVVNCILTSNLTANPQLVRPRLGNVCEPLANNVLQQCCPGNRVWPLDAQQCKPRETSRYLCSSDLSKSSGPCSLCAPLQVYALLHRQEVFAPFRSQQRFADLMENIFLVLDHFNAKVRSQREHPGRTALS